MVRVLFVCLGNICRSPTAQGVFEGLVERQGLAHAVGADSAGTGSWHIGKPPDRRALEAARRRGIDLSRYRARQVVAEDFHRFDLVLAMDRDNHRALQRIAPGGPAARLGKFMDFAPAFSIDDVPDPYYGGVQGFETVLDMIEAGSRGLLDHIRAEYADRLAAGPQR
ncbi:MAG: low molecular weight protein-tyrosine-phosphatase [Alphaproteobacteria bacterium]|nr:low molecular weight protein-tyrosine-phosphatase [Alphaproteobacteria bacterium]